MTLQTVVFRALAATTIVGAGLWTTPAAATADGPDHYRVVDVQGNDTLRIRVRPTQYSRTLGSIPFNARGIRHTADYRRGWVRVIYRGRRGWVSTRYLAEDSPNAEATYRVTGVSYGDRLNLRRRPSHRASILRTIPRRATGIHACGKCRNGWCPVTYRGRDGWVKQRYLKVERYSPRIVVRSVDRLDRFDSYDDNVVRNRNRYSVRDRYNDEDSYQTTGSYQTTNGYENSYRQRNRARAEHWRAKFRKWFYGY